MGRPKGSKNKSKAGRKTKMTPETIKKLEEAFSLDCTIAEACFYAGISHETYYNYLKKNKGAKERFQALRNNPVLIARKTVVEKLPKDAELSLKYLERKRKKEFSPRSEITGEDGGPIKQQIIKIGQSK